jgi:hypothetical protein
VFGFKNVRHSGLLRLRLDAGEKTTADAAIKANAPRGDLF